MEVGPNPIWLMSLKEEIRIPFMHRGKIMWTQREDSHLQTKERGLRRNEPCWHFDLKTSNLQDQKLWGNKFLFKPPVCGTQGSSSKLIQHPESSYEVWFFLIHLKSKDFPQECPLKKKKISTTNNSDGLNDFPRMCTTTLLAQLSIIICWIIRAVSLKVMSGIWRSLRSIKTDDWAWPKGKKSNLTH